MKDNGDQIVKSLMSQDEDGRWKLSTNREDSKCTISLLHCFPPTEVTSAPLWRRNRVIDSRDDQKSILEVYCAALNLHEKEKEIKGYNSLNCLYFPEVIYIWEKNIHIYNQTQIYLYTWYVEKNSWQVILFLYFLEL